MQTHKDVCAADTKCEAIFRPYQLYTLGPIVIARMAGIVSAFCQQSFQKICEVSMMSNQETTSSSTHRHVGRQQLNS